MLCRNVQLSEQRLAKGLGLNGRSGLRSPVQYCSFHFHTLGPADSYNLVFDGLAQNLEDGVSKLGRLVQKKDASVAQGHPSRSGQPTSADQTRVRFNV